TVGTVHLDRMPRIYLLSTYLSTAHNLPDMVWLLIFFKEEGGIRDGHVTGVQTCALPICIAICRSRLEDQTRPPDRRHIVARRAEIGRASCRERVYITVVAASLKKKIGGDVLTTGGGGVPGGVERWVGCVRGVLDGIGELG